MKRRSIICLFPALIGVILLAACVPSGSRFPSTAPSQTAPSQMAAPDEPAAESTPGEKTYYDPEGWYSINYPADWLPGSDPGVFTGEDGFVETGYLPELGYMRHGLDACQWLANIDYREYGSRQVSLTSVGGECRVSFRAGDEPQRSWRSSRNSSAALSHRFLYIKSNDASIDKHPGVPLPG